ncbi:MAG: hypothetical protein KIT84_05745 [Labilithrix sp.]|nr:hypothetical protein [Labilithrix sp.]MCW5810492.1 hypothetical protein [Labilithrix sp.]
MRGGPSNPARVVVPVLVFLVALKTAAGLAGTIDVELDDETIYLDAAHHLRDRYLPLAESSPLYPAWYRVLSLAAREPLSLYYLNWFVLALALPLLLYALARRSGASLGFAATASAVWSFSGAVLVNPFVSKFAVLVLAAGALASTFARERRVAFALGSAAVSVAAYARAELLVPSYAFAAAAAIHGVVGRRRRPLASLFVVAVPAVLRLVFGEPRQGWRAFFAFGQHYARNVIRARHLGVDAWTTWEEHTRADFPHATTILEAARENPEAFLWHVGENAKALPRAIVAVVGPLRYVPLFLVVVVALVLVVLVLVGIRALVRRRLDARLVGWMPLYLVVLLTTLGSALLIHPREHVLLPLVWLSLAALASAPGTVVPPLLRPRLRGIVQVALLASLLALLPARSGAPPALLRPAVPPPSSPPEAAETIRALRSLGLKQKTVILETSYSRAVYAGFPFERVGQQDKRGPFWDFVHERGVGLVVIDDRLRRDPRFANDPQFSRFAAGDGEREDFELVPVERTAVVLAVRRRLR